MADDRPPFEPLRAEPPAFVTLEDYEEVARDKLNGPTYDYIAGGAGDEWTLWRNRRAFERWMLRPRFLRGAGSPDTTANVMRTPVAFPVLVAPWAYQRLADPEGELATRRAASKSGTVMVVSSTALDILEEVARAAPGPAWWQLYVFSDRGATSEMLARVKEAGYGAIVWTVDFPVNGLRHRDTRNGFVMPIGVEPEGLVYDPDLTWDDLAWIRERVPGIPVLVKGLLTAEDAALAVEQGADAVVVSNHGGRQLDGVPGGLDALAEVVDAVAGRIPVLMDGGVRRGTDVLKALGLGAEAVLVGRPVAWGLAAAGEEGVAGVLRILQEEVANAMALTGCRTVSDIGPDLVTQVPG